MITRTMLGVLVVALLTCAAGCDNYQRNHDVIREQARDRMNLVNADVSYKQAEQYFEVGQFDKALKEINGAIARFPKSVPYFTLRGRINMETKKLEPGIESFNEAIVTGLIACGVEPLVEPDETNTDDPNTRVQASQLNPADPLIVAADNGIKSPLGDEC